MTEPTPAELVARARALQPLLREHAAKTDADRRVPAECIDALGEAGLFKVAVPKRYGGYATTLRAMLDVSAAVAEGDGSAGWVVALVNVCNWLTALFPEQAQQEVFADPQPRVTGVLTPSATTRKVDGGWQVSGRWYFNSGSWWSTWAVLGVPLTDENGEVVDQGLVLIPAADLAIEDVWYVAGMRGTASNCLVATDVFVPSHRVMSVPAAIEGSYPTPFTDEALFRSAFVPVLTLVLAGPQLGMGQAALDLVIDKAAKKPISYTFFETQAESVAFQLQIADAATKIDAASLICYRAAADIDDAAARGEYLDYRNPRPGPRRHRVRGAERGRGTHHLDERARGRRLRGLQPAAADLAGRQRRGAPRCGLTGDRLRGLRQSPARRGREDNPARLTPPDIWSTVTMRIANLSGRLVLITGGRAVDVREASEGRFESDPQAIYDRWAEFRSWAAQADLPAGAEFGAADLGAPAPAPRQLLAAGLNYRDHAGESGFAVPEGLPPVFTKFASSITGPVTTVRLPPGGHTDWEIELVVVIGARAWQVAESDAWRHVAGLTIGQDLSERISQLAGPAPQFSLGKSLPGFTPMGPYLVTPDEFANPDDLGLRATINGEQVQKARTSELIFSVPALISRLSARLPLLPGDVIFTGTPAGVGLGRDPQRWLADGDELVSVIDGIGELRQRFTAA